MVMNRLFLRVGAAFFVASALRAGDFTLKTAEQAPPPQIGESIRGLLQPKAIQLMNGDKAAFQLWLRQEIPLKSKPSSPAAALAAIPETTWLGALSIQADGFKDYKDNDIARGIYTIRFALQPQDGDHLGTAEFNYFAVLLPPDLDKETNSFTKFAPMVKASGKLTSSGHPQVLSLRPVSTPSGEIPAITEPAPEHKAIRLKLSGKPADSEKTELTFDLVYQGHGHIQ
jgi:hypothetical protein